MSALDVPIFGNFLHRSVKPRECYIFWERQFKGFGQPFRDFRASDVTEFARSNFNNSVSRLVTSNRNRLLIKVTGWSRIGFLNEIFPNAQFIHIKRDGRDVVNSLLNVDFWTGWEGPYKWRWGALSVEEDIAWRNGNQSFAVLAAIQWVKQMAAINSGSESISASRFMEIRYEDLVSCPTETLIRVSSFSGLPLSPLFLSRIARFKLTDMNGKRENNLPAAERQMVDAYLHRYLVDYGYQEKM